MRSSSDPQVDAATGPAKQHTEAELVQAAYRRLRQCDSVLVCSPAPLLGRCVDLAYVASGAVTTVEFKLRDWRRAIRQARDHRLAADYAFICMPERQVSAQMLSALDDADVGLLFYVQDTPWPFVVVKEAPRSSEIWAAARSALCEYILARAGG